MKKKEIKKRQIILETDGNSVTIVQADVSGILEFQAILNLVLASLKK